MHLPLDDVFAAMRALGTKLVYVRAMERRKDQETEQIAQIHNDQTDPVLQAMFEAVASDVAARCEQLCDALRDVIESYCDMIDPVVVRIHLYTHKSVRLRTFTVRSPGSSGDQLPERPKPPEPVIRIDNIDDLLTQRLVATMGLQQSHVEHMSANYQKLFELVERILAKVAGLMEQRATKAERHALDMLDKRIAEKRVELDLTADDRKKEGDVAVKEKAIETAGGVIEKLLGGVLGALGLDTGTLGQLGGLMQILDGDPELKSMISDPATVNALKNSEVRNIVKGMFHNFKTGTLDADDVGGATPEA